MPNEQCFMTTLQVSRFSNARFFKAKDYIGSRGLHEDHAECHFDNFVRGLVCTAAVAQVTNMFADYLSERVALL